MPKEKVLVVDDDSAIRYTLTEALRGWGMDEAPISPPPIVAASQSAEVATPSSKLGATPSFQLPDVGIDLEQVELSLVRQAMERSGGNQTRAAELLGVSRDQLRYRLKKIEESHPEQ